MITLFGTVSHVQHTLQVSGGENTTSTTHICLFRIDGQQMQFKSSRPIAVADGDTVVIAGRQGGSGFKADAIRNLSTGVAENNGVASKIVLGLLVLAGGLFLINATSASLGWYTLLLCLAVAAASGTLFYHALLTRDAKRAVMTFQPPGVPPRRERRAVS